MQRLTPIHAGSPQGLVPGWVERWGPRAFRVGIGLLLVTTVVWPLAYSHEVDLSIYRMGGEAIEHHAPLYAMGLTGRPNELLFNYPPFAAAVLAPLNLLPLTLLRLLAPVANFLLLVFVVRRCWQSLGVPNGKGLSSLTMLASGALLWLEPVRTTIALGQIGLALLAIVVVDLLPLSGPGRWQGVGVGIAAGIKLTPLFFIPFLIVTRRFRAAAVATATFLVTVLIGFLLGPVQAYTYWFRGIFDDPNRIAPVNSSGNESLRGALARVALPASAEMWAWVVGVVLLSIICLAVAARAHAEEGGEVLAVSLCGLGSAAISPYSWGYHWVWFVPIAVFLAERAIIRHSRAAASLVAGLWTATAAWMTGWRPPLSGMTPPSGLISLHPGGALEAITRNTYLIELGVALGITIVAIRNRTSPDGSDSDGGSPPGSRSVEGATRPFRPAP